MCPGDGECPHLHPEGGGQGGQDPAGGGGEPQHLRHLHRQGQEGQEGEENCRQCEINRGEMSPIATIMFVFTERDLLHPVGDHRGDREGAARGEQQVQVQLQAARHRQELLQLRLRQVSEGSIT